MPAYGAPAALAALVRARATFFGGACITTETSGTPSAVDEAAYRMPLDFYAAYHVPFLATWSVCELAMAKALQGDRATAAKLLEAPANRAPGRRWLQATLQKIEQP
jgi:hypothetical protein